MPQKQRAIVSTWRRRIRGMFIVLRHREDGSIFVSLDDQKGLSGSWHSIAPAGDAAGRGPARWSHRHAAPLQKEIITDGLLHRSEAPVEDDLKQGLERIYQLAEKNGMIITRL